MRRGIALVLVVFTLAALSALSITLTFLAIRQKETIAVVVGADRARGLAETAARDAFATWSTDDVVDRLRADAGDRPRRTGTGRDSQIVRIRQIAPSLFLIRATGVTWTGKARVRAHTGLLVRVLDPIDLLADLPAAVTAGRARLSATATLRVDPAESGGALEPGGCEGAVAAADSAFGPTVRPALLLPDGSRLQDGGARILAPVRLRADPAAAGVSADRAVGPLSWATAATIADRRVAGTIRPRPRAAGSTCATDAPDNWGDPEAPERPCGGYRPVIHAAEDLVVSGGVGQGVLLVDGDVTLTGGARFHGAIIASGTVRVADGAAVYGALRAVGPEGAVRIEDGAVHDSVCAVWRALRGAPALDRAFRPRGRWWLPAF